MLLTPFSAPPASRAARSPACCASMGLDTEPDSITPSPTPSIWISEFGSVCFNAARQIDHYGFADAERQKPRIHLPVGGNNRRRGAIVARHHRGQDRVERQR